LFRTKLLAANRLFAQERTKFDIEQKSTFLLEIMTQLSAANNTDSDMEFILWGRSCILRTTETQESILGDVHFSMYCRHRKKI